MIDTRAFKNIAVVWNDAHRYSPAPRHRRRLMARILETLSFQTCLDVGCAQPYLLAELHQQGKRVFGCDISDQVIASNREGFPEAEYAELDITKSRYPGNQHFDLVIASEMLEHVAEWPAAVANLCAMSGRYVLITVPSGKLHPIDRLVGHQQHFAGPELLAEIRRHGMVVIRAQHWGFPFHSLYKYLINGIAPEKMYASFGTASYSAVQKWISQILYWLFFVNDAFGVGQQFICLAERPRIGSSSVKE